MTISLNKSKTSDLNKLESNKSASNTSKNDAENEEVGECDEDHGGADSGKQNAVGENICMAVMNLSSRILIAVIVGVPFALKEAGFGLGILLILFVAFLSDYTLGLLVRAGELAGETTYLGVSKAAFGKFGVLGVLFKQFVYPFIIMVASNTIIGDIIIRLVSAIVGHDRLEEAEGKIYANRQFIIGVVTVFTTLPLSLYRDVTKLSKFSSVSIISLWTMLVFVIIRFANLDLPKTVDAYRFADIDAFRALGILIAVYMCHHSSFMIFHSMLKPTHHRKREASHASMALSMATTLALGIVVYATFTDDTYGNFLNNYCSTDVLMNVGRALYVFSVLLAFPGEVIVARLVIEESFFKQPSPTWRHVLITVFIIGASVAATLATPCLSILLELNGVANAAPLALIMPPTLVLKLQKKPLLSLSNIPLYVTAMIGLTITAFGIYRTVVTIIDGIDCAHMTEPAYCLPDLNTTWANTTQMMTTI